MNRRTVMSLVALGLLLVVGAYLAKPLWDDPRVWPPDDYVEYWAAGRLNLTGGNPYSPEALLPLEQAAGRDTDEAIMMWNPPWTLSVAMPLGSLPARLGQFVWLLVQAGGIVAAAWLLNPPKQRTTALAIAFTFVPSLFLLQSGQIAGLILLGAALFVTAAQMGYPLLAGVAGVLIAIKPHLAYLLWIAVAVESLRSRNYRIALGGILGGVVFTLIPMAFNPDVWKHYFGAYRDHPPTQWVSLTPGMLLRVAFGERHFWLQFLPMLAGIAWYWKWQNENRRKPWAEKMPAILLVSFVTAPYGAWHFDLVLLLIPLWHSAINLAEAQRKFALGLLIAANLGMLALHAAGAWSYAYAWVAPLALVAYYGFRVRLPQSTAVPA